MNSRFLLQEWKKGYSSSGFEKKNDFCWTFLEKYWFKEKVKVSPGVTQVRTVIKTSITFA